MTAPSNAAPGDTTLTATAATSVNATAEADRHGDVQVPYTSLGAAMNNVAICDDANPAGANFDGGGYSYSAQALAAVNLTPGQPVTHDDLASRGRTCPLPRRTT